MLFYAAKKQIINFILVFLFGVIIICSTYLFIKYKEHKEKVAENINNCASKIAEKYNFLNSKDYEEFISFKEDIIAHKNGINNSESDFNNYQVKRNEINDKIINEKIKLSIAEHALIQRVRILKMVNGSVGETPEGLLIHFINASYDNHNSGFTTAEHYILQPMENPDKENGIDFNNWSAILVSPGLDGISEAKKLINSNIHKIKNEINNLISENSNLKYEVTNINGNDSLNKLYDRFKNIEKTKRNMELMKKELFSCISNILNSNDFEKINEHVNKQIKEFFMIDYYELSYSIDKYRTYFEKELAVDRDSENGKFSGIENIQSKKSEPKMIHCEGVINSKMKISMSLMIDESEVTGYYSYDNIGLPISLRGIISPNGDIILDEFPGSPSQVGQDESTGKFHGKISDNCKLYSGNWISKKISYTFNLNLYNSVEKSLKFEHVYCTGGQDEDCMKLSLTLISTGNNEIDKLLYNNDLKGYEKERFNTALKEGFYIEDFEKWESFSIYNQFKSYINYSSTYNGQPHPESQYKYYTIDKNLNRIVNLNDCISDKLQFLKIIHSKLKKKYTFIDYQDLENDNSLPEDFYFCKYGIGIMYNRSIFGSHEDGPLEIVIPWKEIDYLLDHNFFDF